MGQMQDGTNVPKDADCRHIPGLCSDPWQFGYIYFAYLWLDPAEELSQLEVKGIVCNFIQAKNFPKHFAVLNKLGKQLIVTFKSIYTQAQLRTLSYSSSSSHLGHVLLIITFLPSEEQVTNENNTT